MSGYPAKDRQPCRSLRNGRLDGQQRGRCRWCCGPFFSAAGRWARPSVGAGPVGMGGDLQPGGVQSERTTSWRAGFNGWAGGGGGHYVVAASCRWCHPITGQSARWAWSAGRHPVGGRHRDRVRRAGPISAKPLIGAGCFRFPGGQAPTRWRRSPGLFRGLRGAGLGRGTCRIRVFEAELAGLPGGLMRPPGGGPAGLARRPRGPDWWGCVAVRPMAMDEALPR